MESFEQGLGKHYLIELYSCKAGLLDDALLVEESLLKACELSGATIINSLFHQFAPQGVSGVVVIAESHFSIHTWPENGYAALDLFTCSPKLQVDLAIEMVEEAFECQKSEVKVVVRGEECLVDF